jgi:hypothetical protein
MHMYNTAACWACAAACALLLQMQRGVEDLLQHQRLQLRAEEAVQLRQFRVRLAEVEAQLAADKRAAAADQDSWMSKTVSLALCT